MKKCSKCKEIKDISLFYKSKEKYRTHYSNCKICCDKTTMKWRKTNPDKYKACEKRRIRIWTPDPVGRKRKIEKDRKRRKDMTNGYICELIVKRTEDLKIKDIPLEMIEAKREHLKLIRNIRDD